MIRFLDILFVVFHSVLILFILFGWTHPRLRRLHLLCVLLTGASWFILGLFYGIGYCPLTDWHWQVLSLLGKTDLPPSYVQYILDRLLGISISFRTADAITLAGWLGALAIAAFLQVRRIVRRR